MQRDAESHADEDKRKRQLGRTAQPGRFDVLATGETAQGARRQAGRGRQGGRHRAIEKTRAAAKGEDVEAIKAAVHELEQASHALSRTLYASAGAQPAPPRPDGAQHAPNGQPSGASAGGGEDEPIDAEFEVKE